MQNVEAIADLEALYVCCKDLQESEVGLLYAAVAFATARTHSDLGFISVVDPVDPALLHARERFVVAPSPRVWRYNDRFSLQIGGIELPRNERSLSGYVAHTRRPYHCPDVQQDPYYLSVDDNVRSEIGAPIIQDDQLLGVINVESYTRAHYSPQHENFLGQIARLIAGPLARLRAREQMALIPRIVAADFARLCQDHHATSHDFLQAVLARIEQRMKISKGYARIKDGPKLVLRALWPREEPGSERLLFHQGLFLAIGAEDLLPDQRSFAGYIAQSEQPCRVEDLHTFPWYMQAHPELQSALGARIVYGSDLLGIITLMHDEKGYYTAWHEAYLAAFVRQIAGPLYGLLTAEHHRPPHKAIYATIKDGLQSLDIDDPFGTYRGAHFVAAQIACAMRSTLCTIWLVDAKNDLRWQGVFGLPPSVVRRDAGQAKRVAQAIHNVFGVSPVAFCPEIVARGETVSCKTLVEQRIYNCGPNRNSIFLNQDYVQPFLVMPLLSHEGRALGVIHVGMKEITPDNPYGVYLEADEQLLESLQLEVITLYEGRQLRRTAEYAVQDLHDALGLVTTDLLYGIDRARTELQVEDYPCAERALDDIERNTQSLLRELRCIMFGLKAQTSEELGLIEALEDFITHNVRRPGLDVDFQVPSLQGRLPIQYEWQLYRIAQEALTNMITHAEATSGECRLDIRLTHVTLSVRDNGKGFDPVLPQDSSRYGLGNMKRRAKSLGGTLQVTSAPGQGTLVTADIPR